LKTQFKRAEYIQVKLHLFRAVWRLSCCRGSLSTESDVGDVRAGGGHFPRHNIALTSNGTTCHGVGHAGGVRVW